MLADVARTTQNANWAKFLIAASEFLVAHRLYLEQAPLVDDVQKPFTPLGSADVFNQDPQVPLGKPLIEELGNVVIGDDRGKV